MDCPYTVLPDGSILWLTCPEDYRIAADIIRDEVGSRQPNND